MNLPESSTTMRMWDFKGIAAPAPLPAQLATSPTNLPLSKPLMAKTGTIPPPTVPALAFTFGEGIMVVAGYSSQSSESAKNVVELNSHMLAIICGGSKLLLQDLQEKCHQHEETEGSQPLVTDLSEWLSEILPTYKEESPIGILIAVSNEKDLGLYCMNDKGELVKDDIVLIGCNSAGPNDVKGLLLDRERKLPVSDVTPLAEFAYCTVARKAPNHGNNFSVYHVGSGGCNKVDECDIEFILALE